MAGPLNTGKAPSGPSKFDAVVRLFKPDPPAQERITDPQEIKSAYKAYQKQILMTTMVGYAGYYLVRKNWSVVMPALEAQMGISKSDLGWFLTAHGIVYGISKFLNGIFGDRCNARTFMVTGLILSLILNVFVGMGNTALWLGFFWMLNGWVQGMGFPPCARLVTNWFHPKELATKMSIWNTSHSIGAALTILLCTYLVKYDWRLGMFVPAGIALLIAVYMKMTMPDLPESKGLPPIAVTAAEKASFEKNNEAVMPISSMKEVLMKRVFSNYFIWMVSVANFFVYVIRMAFLDWGPTFLQQYKHFTMEKSGWLTVVLELSGITGMLLGGLLTDRVFQGRGVRACVFYMLACSALIVLFWLLPTNNFLLSFIILCGIGFFIYGPQALVGVIVANLATKEAAASAVGLTGLFAYVASSIITGAVLGTMAENHGWAVVFEFLIAIAIAGTVMFALAWKAPADGYDK